MRGGLGVGRLRPAEAGDSDTIRHLTGELICAEDAKDDAHKSMSGIYLMSLLNY